MNGIGDSPTSLDICVMAKKRVTVQPSDTVAVTTEEKVVDAQPTEGVLPVESEEKKVEEKPVEEKKAETEKKSPKKSPQKKAKSPAKESPKAEEKKEGEATEEKKTQESVAPKEATDQTEPVTAPTVPTDTDVAELTLEQIETLLKSKHFAEDICLQTSGQLSYIKLKDNVSQVDVTLFLNDDNSVRNTSLIRDYGKIDWRFPRLAMVLKQWARANGLCEGSAISGHSLTLMTIHYLQVCKPPVLPRLQAFNPNRYDPSVPLDKSFGTWRRFPNHWRSNNADSLRQLLTGLFHYYDSEFNFAEQIVSIDEESILKRADLVAATADQSSSEQWSSSPLCIRDPYSKANTAHAVQSKDLSLLGELVQSAWSALTGPHPSLPKVISSGGKDGEIPEEYFK